MKPETIQKLQENIPELKELIAFLASEAQKLNTLDGINQTTMEEVALETRARQRAYDTLTKMLAPLVGPVEKVVGANPKDYVA